MFCENLAVRHSESCAVLFWKNDREAVERSEDVGVLRLRLPLTS